MKDMMSFGIIAILVALVAAIAYFGNKQITALAEKVRQLSNDVQALQRNLQILSERGPPPQVVNAMPDVYYNETENELPIPPYNPLGPSLPVGESTPMMAMDDSVVREVLGETHGNPDHLQDAGGDSDAEAEDVTPDDDDDEGTDADATEATEATEATAEPEPDDVDDVLPTPTEMMSHTTEISSLEEKLNKVRKPKKRVPSAAPSNFDEGHVEVSEFNGKKYIVVVNSRGHKRWHTLRPEEEAKLAAADAEDAEADTNAEKVDAEDADAEEGEDEDAADADADEESAEEESDDDNAETVAEA